MIQLVLRCAIALLIPITSLAAAEVKPLPLLSAVYCQALLTTIQPGEFTVPLGSLRDLIELHKKRLNKTADGSAYRVNDYSGDLKSGVSIRQRELHAAALARLQQIERDTTVSQSDEYAYAGFELRGKDKIRNFFTRLNPEVNRLNSEVWQELRKHYPAHRLSAYYYSLTTAVVGGMGIYFMATTVDPINFIVGGVMTWAATIGNIAHSLVKQYIGRAFGVDKQIELMLSTLDEQTPSYPFSIQSLNFHAHTEFHRALMNSQQPSLNLTAAASDEGVRDPFMEDGLETLEQAARHRHLSLRDSLRATIEEARQEAIRYPEGARRHIAYDSIFYRDPQSDEPVWLIYYRAFKSDPLSRQKPPPPPAKKATDSHSGLEWAPGLIPIKN